MAKDGINYQRKYMDLRARFIESLDVAFRTGYEQGFNESQNQAMAQQAQMQAQQAMQMGQPGAQEQMAQEQQMAQDGELDQKIAELEQMVNKSELNADDLKKSVDELKTSRMFSKMIKATQEIEKKINKGVPAPLSLSYNVNLPEVAKQGVSMQEKILADILSKWEQESASTSRDITQILGTQGIPVKE